jgi:uncharacterized protein YxeA
MGKYYSLKKIPMKEVVMKRLLIVIAILVLVVAFAYARSPKSDYQWTGSVVEVDSDHIIVQKGDEKWEFAHDKDTKTTGTLKDGAKVTVKYLMKATSIEVKEEGSKPAPKKK